MSSWTHQVLVDRPTLGVIQVLAQFQDPKATHSSPSRPSYHTYVSVQGWKMDVQGSMDPPEERDQRWTQVTLHDRWGQQWSNGPSFGGSHLLAPLHRPRGPSRGSGWPHLTKYLVDQPMMWAHLRSVTLHRLWQHMQMILDVHLRWFQWRFIHGWKSGKHTDR